MSTLSCINAHPPHSGGTDATDQSNDDETASIYSDDGTDCEEDILSQSSGCSGQYRCNDKKIIGPILDPLKRALVDRVMVEFHTLFEATWIESASAAHEAGNERNSSPNSTRAARSSSKSSSFANRGGKRGMSDRDADVPDDENEENNPKRLRLNSTQQDTSGEVLKLACPFHKHNPQKYGINHSTGSTTYRTCAGPGWDTVGRMK
jgi:hypothetical protein